MAHYFAADDAVPFEAKAEANARKQAQAPATLEAYAAWLEARLGEGRALRELGEVTKAWVQERGLKIPALFQPLRCALSGHPGGRDLFEIMDLLGPQSTLRRIREGARRLALSPA